MPTLRHEFGESPGYEAPNGLDRNLAMFGYLCLFFTVLFGGLPAFVMVILAYARRGEVDAVTRSHLRFQIKSFWWCFWLTVLGGVALIAAIILGFGEFVHQVAPAAAAWTDRLADQSGRPTGALVWMTLAGSGALLLWATLWTLFAPLWGGFKLAVGAPIGRA